MKWQYLWHPKVGIIVPKRGDYLLSTILLKINWSFPKTCKSLRIRSSNSSMRKLM